ncbi:unnamed protein product [Closterium sp. NIES-54]
MGIDVHVRPSPIQKPPFRSPLPLPQVPPAPPPSHSPLPFPPTPLSLSSFPGPYHQSHSKDIPPAPSHLRRPICADSPAPGAFPRPPCGSRTARSTCCPPRPL